jgi:PAS domain S-box-containing protein
MKSKTQEKNFAFTRLRDFAGNGMLAHLIIEFSDDAIISKTLDERIASWNHGAEIMYGYKQEEMIGKNISILIPPDMPNELPNLMKRISNGHHIPHYETKRIRKDGTVIDVSLSLSPIIDKNGKTIGVATVSRDITGRTRSERYARSLIEAGLDPMVTISPAGKITDVNQATINITGYSRKKLIGTDFSDYFTEPARAREGYKKVFKQGFVRNYPLTLRSIKGTLTDVLYNATVYKDDAGNVLGVFAAARDISETTKASRYARDLIEASLDPLVTISPKGKITDVNQALVEVTGVPRDKLIGTDFSDYFTDPRKARKGYLQVLKNGFVKDYSLVIKSTDGKLTDVLYNATVYKDTHGNALGVFAAARDVTAQKKLAERESAAREKEMQRIAELEKFQKLTVGRELKMIELKKEIEELRKKLNSR